MKRYGAKVVGAGKALPEKILTNHDLEKIVDTSDEWIATRTGIRQRHVVSGEESISGLAVQAARRALQMARLDPGELDLIIVGTFTADHRLPSCACIVQAELGAHKAGAFDINSACTGFIYSLVTAAQFVKAGGARNVLVVGADATSSVLDWKDRNTCVLFGDGASALILSQDENPLAGVASHYMCTDGTGMCNLWIPNGGSRNPLDEQNILKRDHFVKMSGKDVFKFAIQAIVEASRKVMEQEGLQAPDLKLMVPHQANVRIINAAAKRLDFGESQIYVNIDRYGNTVGASVGLALCDAHEEGLIEAGDKVLVVGFGAGLSWGATIIEWGQE